MVYVRKTIVSDASIALSRAVTIATRYSAVRRQFGAQDDGLETQVPDQGDLEWLDFIILSDVDNLLHDFFIGSWLQDSTE